MVAKSGIHFQLSNTVHPKTYSCKPYIAVATCNRKGSTRHIIPNQTQIGEAFGGETTLICACIHEGRKKWRLALTIPQRSDYKGSWGSAFFGEGWTGANDAVSVFVISHSPSLTGGYGFANARLQHDGVMWILSVLSSVCVNGIGVLTTQKK
jgi:hypothetical protein